MGKSDILGRTQSTNHNDKITEIVSKLTVKKLLCGRLNTIVHLFTKKTQNVHTLKYDIYLILA